MRFLLLTLLFALVTTFARAEAIHLSLNWKPEPQFGGFYTAAHDGLFKKASLEVEVHPGGSGTPTIQMLASGATDYAIVSADEVVLAFDRGAQDLVALFAAYQTNPQAIMAHAEKGYKNLDDLRVDPKATLLWQAGLPYAQFLKKKQTKFMAKTAPYLGGIANFQHDPQVAQQCFVTSEPVAAERAGLKTSVFLVADQGYNPYTTVLVTKASRLKQKPDEVKKVVQAVREGWHRYLTDPKETNSFMHSLNKAMDPETFTASSAAQTKLVQPAGLAAESLGTMTEARWSTLIDQLADLKLIKAKPKALDLFRNL